jgi:hypothetical protein
MMLESFSRGKSLTQPEAWTFFLSPDSFPEVRANHNQMLKSFSRGKSLTQPEAWTFFLSLDSFPEVRA